VRWRHHFSASRHQLIVTEYVLVEIGNGLSARRYRQLAATIIAGFRNSADVEFIPASPELLDAALALYQNRLDKDWGLTDCASFVVMTERGLTDALTPDEHFRQAGFRPLLLEEPPPAAGP
jgi:predicted nucleic acid-binding protein